MSGRGRHVDYCLAFSIEHQRHTTIYPTGVFKMWLNMVGCRFGKPGERRVGNSIVSIRVPNEHPRDLAMLQHHTYEQQMQAPNFSQITILSTMHNISSRARMPYCTSHPSLLRPTPPLVPHPLRNSPSPGRILGPRQPRLNISQTSCHCSCAHSWASCARRVVAGRGRPEPWAADGAVPVPR